MHEILKKRLMRKLEALPEGQLYQVLDYIEFLESRYATGPAAAPGGVQGFAERLEDRLRARRVMPEVMSGTMKVLGTAGRLVDGLSQAGRGIVEGMEAGLRPTEQDRRPTSRSGPRIDPARRDENGPPAPSPPARDPLGREDPTSS